MVGTTTLSYVAAVAGFGASAALTPLVRAAARRTGFVATPRADRWHARPTAMMGGIGIFLAALTVIVALVPLTRDRYIVLGTSAVMFAFGLVDDLLELKPYQKLIGQFIAASAVIYFGLILPWTGLQVVNIGITFLWLIGITNAVNLLDNMDGLATGVSAVAAGFLAVNFIANNQSFEAVALLAFTGALLGFLIYNHNPASIFMGDCGSMFIGFFLASSALLAGTGGGRSRSIVSVLAVPVLVLVVPIFDTTFVAVMRKLAGRSMMKGGRDHTSHRLVALGLSERHAVWLLWVLALTSGALGMFARQLTLDMSVATIVIFVVGLTFLGTYLARVRVYDETEIAAAREKPLMSFLLDLSYKRRVFEVLLDVVLITLSYYFAYVLKFGSFDNSSLDWRLFTRTLPIVVGVKLVTFLGTGIYRGIWRYASVSNLFDYFRAVALGSLATMIAVVFTFRFDGFSRAVFVLDGLLLAIMLVASRFSFRILRRLFPSAVADDARRVVIYGAGDGGELVFRELRNNPSLGLVPVAFLDDDPVKVGRRVHALPVFAAITIGQICSRLKAEEILISTDKIPAEHLALLVGEAAVSGIRVTRAYMKFQTLAPSDFGWVLSSDSDTELDTPLIAARGETSLLHAKAQPRVEN